MGRGSILWCCIGLYLALMLWSSHSTTTTMMTTSDESNKGSKNYSSWQKKQQLFTTSTTTTMRHHNSTTTTTTTKKMSMPAGTVVMQVRGEMENHLQKIAHGYGIHSWYAQDKFDERQTHLQPAKPMQLSCNSCATCGAPSHAPPKAQT
jgi:hypothetical protein